MGREVRLSSTAIIPRNRSSGPYSDHKRTDHIIELTSKAGGPDGYRTNLPTAQDAVDLLHHQAATLACWGNALYMAIGELCDNALQHGHNDLGGCIATDRVTEPRREFRLAIADLGIGIPEHIRSRHPEWQDDTAAIASALDRGVTGTDDPYRGNGFAEVFDEALSSRSWLTQSTP